MLSMYNLGADSPQKTPAELQREAELKELETKLYKNGEYGNALVNARTRITPYPGTILVYPSEMGGSNGSNFASGTITEISDALAAASLERLSTRQLTATESLTVKMNPSSSSWGKPTSALSLTGAEVLVLVNKGIDKLLVIQDEIKANIAKLKATPLPLAAAPMSMGVKVGIGVGAALVVGGVAFALLKRKS